MKRFAKRTTAVFLLACTLALAMTAFFGCEEQEADGKINILCVLFPEYDWAKNIVGNSEDITVKLLISNGTDMHSYQPTARDIALISECDLLVYGGGDATEWIGEALLLAENEGVNTLDISKIEGVRLHEISSSSHEHEDGSHTSHEGHDHSGHDEHLWLSLKNAAVIVGAMGDRIACFDEANREKYILNAKLYREKLGALDIRLEELVKGAPEEDRFLLFADRFPFVYLLYDYGIGYRAPFEGCSTDANADFATVVSLIKEADAHGCKYIALTESGDEALADTVMSSAKRGDMETVRLHSMQSVRREEIENGASYLSYMEDNFEVLKKILSGGK